MQTVKLVIVIVMVLLGNCKCGRVINGRIVGGYEISIEQAPYQVALLNYGTIRCGGSILSCKFILTAAHCTATVTQISALTIRAGSSEYGANGSLHEIGRIDIHPKYNSMLFDYDASILTLKTNIKFDSFKQPIKLPFQNEALLAGSHVATSGWGITQNINQTNMVLRMVELKIVNQVECHRAYAADGGITTRMVCATAAGKDACDGDSGGPLIDLNTRKLVGIVSFGPTGSCALNGTPGVYARIASFRSWIRQIVNF